MNFYFEKASNDNKETLYRLLEYSLFEESLTDGNEMNKEAIFEYKYFERYFTENNRDAFIIKENETGKIIGFVMINTYMQKFDNGHSIAEFMIIPTYRRKHIGQNVANKCFDMYKGNWEVSPSIGSEQAYSFWNKVINEYTNGNVKYEDRIFMFNNNEE